MSDFFFRFRLCFADERLPPNARLLLLALLHKANNDTGIATPSAALLVKLTGLPRSTVYEQRAILVRLGYLSIRERSHDDHGQISSEYTLHFPTGTPQHATAALSSRETPAAHVSSAGTGTHVSANQGGDVQGDEGPSPLDTPPPSGYRMPPSLARTGASAITDAPPVRLPEAPPSGNRTQSATSPSATATLREKPDARWSVFYSEYEVVRKNQYGDAGAKSPLTAEQRGAILNGALHVVERTGVDLSRASNVVVELWMKHFPGKDSVLRNRNHPLRYLATDIADVSVMAVRELAPKATRAPRARPDEPPRMAKAEFTAAAAALLDKLK